MSFNAAKGKARPLRTKAADCICGMGDTFLAGGDSQKDMGINKSFNTAGGAQVPLEVAVQRLDA